MRIIAVYPGRFHPFHKGHAASFKQLASKFGLENTYLALSEKQEQPKSPFTAGDRAKMAMALGIPKENIISVRNTYGADEYIKRFEAAGIDPNDTALVYGVSGKDMGSDPRFSFAPKKDGSPSYLQPYTNEVQPMTKHGYVITTNVAEFPVAGQSMTDASQIRAAYMKGDDKVKNQILIDLYGPNAAKLIKPVFDTNLQLTENLYRKLVELKKKLTESRLQNIDEGIVLNPSDLIDIFIKGKHKRKMGIGYEDISFPVATSIPNDKLEKVIELLVKKYNVNPNTIMYGPSKSEKTNEELDDDLSDRHSMDFTKRRFMIRQIAKATGWDISDIELASDEEIQQAYDQHVKSESYLEEN